MDFPLSLGAGVNYRFSDQFSMAFDMDWKQWSKFKQTDQSGVESTPIGDGTGDLADTLAFRLGGEHLWFSGPGSGSTCALRAGVFYEPRPALDDAMSVYGVSLGAGWTINKQLSVDFAYQYRRGSETEGRNLGRGIADVDYSIEEHFLVGSVIWYLWPTR
jgi:long-subunit fatty acid transport protein